MPTKIHQIYTYGVYLSVPKDVSVEISESSCVFVSKCGQNTFEMQFDKGTTGAFLLVVNLPVFQLNT